MTNLFRLQDGSYVLSDELMTKKQLMKKLGVSRATIQLWQRKGLPFVQFNNKRNGYNLKEVSDWLEKMGYPPVNMLSKWKENKQ